MTERLTYPYKKGEFGLPLSPVSPYGVLSESGHTLQVTHSVDRVSIIDAYVPKFRLIAQHNPLEGAISFDLRTRDAKTRVQHPDLRADSFITYAMLYFTLIYGERPVFYDTEWWAWSDNYKAYYDNMKAGMTREEAVWATWTGSQAQKREYTSVIHHRSMIDKDLKKKVIITRFSREREKPTNIVPLFTSGRKRA